MTTVAILGLFGGTNLGNEATLAAFLPNLVQRTPAARLIYIGPKPANASVLDGYEVEQVDLDLAPVAGYFRRLPDSPLMRAGNALTQLATESLRASRTAEMLHECDYLVIPGTGILDDFGQGPFGLPYHLARWSEAARRQSAGVCFLSIGAERVADARTRGLLARALIASSYRSYRDGESRNNASSIDPGAAMDPVFPDLAFSIPQCELPAFQPVSWPPRSIGIGVMGYYGWNKRGNEAQEIYSAYLRKLQRFVSWLVRRGQSVRLLIGDTRADQQTLDELANRLTEQLDGSQQDSVIAHPISNVSDLLQQITATDLVIATRFHNVLLSLLLERPAISLGYSRKNDALMESYGLAPFCQEVEGFSEKRLIEQFQQMENWPVSRIQQLWQTNANYRTELDRQYDQIAAIFREGRPGTTGRRSRLSRA